MIANVDELKELITWARSQRLKSVSINGISFEFSEFAHVESLPDIAATAYQSEAGLDKPASSIKLPDGNAQPTEEDELLFWSARG
jgi:hypothetical protein